MSSLTAPWDREGSEQVASSQSIVLNEEEVQAALSELVDSSITSTFPKVDKMYADPLYNNQTYCLHSFIPSKGATPDAKGVFGFMKCRGAFFNAQEANQRAEWIIRNIDSYHEIQTGYCGRPFPVCADTKKFVAETHEVDIRKQMVETVSEDIKEKRAAEKREIEEMKEREKRLLEETKEDYKEDPLDTYTTLQVKKANLVWTYVQTREKMEGMKKSIQKAYAEIREMEALPDGQLYKDSYYDKYMAARRSAHIPDDASLDNFMKYLMEDADLDFDF
jgi:hypothetical protein